MGPSPPLRRNHPQSMSCVPSAPIPHSLPGPAFTVFHLTFPPTLSPSWPVPNTATLAPLTGIALLPLIQPLLTTAANAAMSSPPFTLAHFPLPLFHFTESDLPPPPTTDPSSTCPSPTLDGTDLIGRVFNDPELGLCRVVEVGPPHRLAPGEGNLDPTGPQLQAGWVPTLR
jgi:hypothetical protein